MAIKLLFRPKETEKSAFLPKWKTLCIVNKKNKTDDIVSLLK
jgi:hypothetical protein